MTAYIDKLKPEAFDLGNKFFSSDIHLHLRTLKKKPPYGGSEFNLSGVHASRSQQCWL
jgi:hypothetical protein